MKPKLKKIAIVSLTSCEGCQFTLFDLGEKFLDFMSKVEMIDFRLFEDEKDKGGKLDIGIVEGSPMTKDNIKILLKLRKRSKLLIVLGNCAAMGGVPEIKNYQQGKATIKQVYKHVQEIFNPEIKEVNNFVKVDFVFPGCPISGDEFLKYFPELLAGNIPIIPDQSVCIECRKKGNKCLLLENKSCFGPIILGGCDAICPTSRMGCQGCRGLRKSGNIKTIRCMLKKMITDQEFKNITEIYGLRDDISYKNF
ncbi:MAG: NADH:ubiquinone oxidoreductase [Patescibacteria group bacterium]